MLPGGGRAAAGGVEAKRGGPGGGGGFSCTRVSATGVGWGKGSAPRGTRLAPPPRPLKTLTVSASTPCLQLHPQPPRSPAPSPPTGLVPLSPPPAAKCRRLSDAPTPIPAQAAVAAPAARGSRRGAGGPTRWEGAAPLWPRPRPAPPGPRRSPGPSRTDWRAGGR